MGGKGKIIKKRKFVGHKEDDPEFDLAKKHLKTSHIRALEKRLIIVLEGSQLETVKVNLAVKIYGLNRPHIAVYHFRSVILLSC